MNQRIGYARVSTNGQNLDLQRDAMHLSGGRPIYEEGASGEAAGRKDARQIREIERLMAELGIPVSQMKNATSSREQPFARHHHAALLQQRHEKTHEPRSN